MNMIYRMRNRFRIFVLAALTAGTVQGQLVDNFESYSDGQSVGNINRWKWHGKTRAATYNYDTAVGYPIPGQHTKVMDVNGVTGSLYSDSDESMVVFTDMIVKPGQFRTAADGHPALSAEATMGLYINEKGHPVVAHLNYDSGKMVWTEISGVTLSATEWHRLTVQLDYRPLDLDKTYCYFTVMVNGKSISSPEGRSDQTGANASGVWFPMLRPDSFDGVYLKGKSASVDDVVLDGKVDFKGVTLSSAAAYEPAAGKTVNADFKVKLSGTSTVPVTVNYKTEDVTATAGLDYTAVSGSVVIDPGKDSTIISVPVKGDAVDDSDEQFILKVTSLQNAVLDGSSQAIGLILDDSGDSDSDGLLNIDEKKIGTDPLVGDTDGDGANDYIENLDGSDPLDPNSLPVNPVNKAPYWVGINNGVEEFFKIIKQGTMTYTARHGGTDVTITAWGKPGKQVPFVIHGTDIIGFGPGSLWKQPEFVRLTFAHDTYFHNMQFRQRAAHEIVKISGPGIGRIHKMRTRAGQVWNLDKAAGILTMSGTGACNTIDDVTGRGIFIKAGESLDITFVNGSASLTKLGFYRAFFFAETTAVGTQLIDAKGGDPNSNDVLSYALTGGNDNGLFALDTASGALTLQAPLSYASASTHRLRAKVTDLAGLSKATVFDIDIFAADADSDGMADIWEFRNFTDFSRDGSGDFDRDGVLDREEYRIGTSPSNSDTDGDGCSDYVEILEGSDPLDKKSVSPNKTNLPPYFLYGKPAKLFGYGIANGVHKHVEVYNGTQVTIRAFNGQGSPVNIAKGSYGKFGAGSYKYRAGFYLSFSFDSDTYFKDIAFGAWGGSDVCRISGKAIAGLNGIDNKANTTFTLNKAGEELLISGASAAVKLIDNVTGKGLFVPAGSELKVTFLNGTASLTYLNFEATCAVKETAKLDDKLFHIQVADPNVNDVLQTQITAGNDDGLFALTSDGFLKVAGALDYETKPTHTLTLRTTDLGGLSTEKDYVVHVLNDNDAPEAVDDFIYVEKDHAVTAKVLDNDIDADGDALQITAVTQGAKGTITTNGTTITYTPAGLFTGEDTFTYTISDGKLTDTATVTVKTSSSPAIGVCVVQTGAVVEWSVEQELDVKLYRLVDTVTGKTVATILADGSILYKVKVKKGIKVELIVVDRDGFEQSFMPEDGSLVVKKYHFLKGWNLIAVIGDKANLSGLRKLTRGPLWHWDDDRYVRVKGIPKAGCGLWAYAEAEQIVTVTARRSAAKVMLNTGWNLMGPLNNINVPEKVDAVYSWNTVYENVLEKYNTLHQGVGYWFFVSEPAGVELK